MRKITCLPAMLLLTMTTYLCCFSVYSNTNSSTVSFLRSQCLNLQLTPLIQTSNLDVDVERFVRSSLLVNNLNDLLRVIKSQKVVDQHSLLLNCQIRLSDQWHQFLPNVQKKVFIERLRKTGKNDHKQLADQLKYEVERHGSENYLSQLRIAEASFKQKQPIKKIIIDSKDKCTTSSNTIITSHKALAQLMLTEKSEHCRKSVWQKYSRQQSNIQLLTKVIDLRNQQAKKFDYSNSLQQQLSYNLLTSAKQVAYFLNKIEDKDKLSPWNIAQALKRADSAKLHYDSNILLLDLLSAMTSFGITAEWINPENIRLWHHQRLLGDVYLKLVNQPKIKPTLQMMRHPVIGHQFAQAALILPSSIINEKQLHRLIQKFSLLITNYADAPHDYLTSRAISNSDYDKLATIWLNKILLKKLSNKYITSSPRSKLAQQYHQHIELLKSHIALAAYRDIGTFSYSETIAYPINFSGLINNGANYYSNLFQNYLANYIINTSHIAEKEIFERLIINETRAPMSRFIQNRLAISSGKHLIDEITRVSSKQ
ncbi:MAG: hypothetical protein ACPGUD_06690 [Parashewanella sp.]